MKLSPPLSEINPVIVMPNEVKGDRGLCHMRVVSFCTAWTSAIGVAGPFCCLLGSRLTFNKVTARGELCIRARPEDQRSARASRPHYLAAQSNCVIVTAGPERFEAGLLSNSSRLKPLCVRVRWKVTCGVGICMCQQL